jgi:hypothetical protein
MLHIIFIVLMLSLSDLVSIHVTSCLEMLDSEQPEICCCSPEGLIKQVNVLFSVSNRTNLWPVFRNICGIR